MNVKRKTSTGEIIATGIAVGLVGGLLYALARAVGPLELLEAAADAAAKHQVRGNTVLEFEPDDTPDGGWLH